MGIEISVNKAIVRSPAPLLPLVGQFISEIIVKKLNSLKHLVRTTVAESHN